MFDGLGVVFVFFIGVVECGSVRYFGEVVDGFVVLVW